VATPLPAAHGARSALTLQATFELQCGRISDVTVGLPPKIGVRRPIARTAVTVNGFHPASARASRHVVALTMPPPQGVMCDSIGPARVTVRFARAAGLVNPDRPGSYAVWLRIGTETVAGRLKIA
jgi:hypothetical protein